MTLQVIKAEDVRDGEPRWWCTDDGYAAQTLTWIDATYLHAEPRSGTTAACHIAIVDRPAPTPTATPALDLDAVEAVERAMTAGPWEMRRCIGRDAACVVTRNTGETVAACDDDDRGDEATPVIDAAGIVALRNVAPALIAEVRALRAKLAEAKKLGMEACGTACALAAETGRPRDFGDYARSIALAAALEAL